MFSVDSKSGVPVYIQLKEGLKLMILQGEYKPGDKLPTVRQMAVELRINSNTVARSYSELEREGFISTQQGRGTFVQAQENAHQSEIKEKEFDNLTDTYLQNAVSLGFSADEIMSRITERLRGGHN